jgi:long-chain fatty acid transport protein
MGAGAQKSDADLSVVPMVAVATKLTDDFYLGVGMWGTAGMGVDYRDSDANLNMVTNLQLMQFGVPLAYKVSGFSIAVTPLLQYGALDINYRTQAGNSSTKGVAQDLEFGYNLGLAYEIADFTFGAVYKSEIEMDYSGQLSQAMHDFTGQPASVFSDKLSTPAEIGVGVSYAFGEHTIALDYKNIQWSSAAGYEDFAWDDQDVIALGYEYTAKNWAARLGYNYASSPISDQGLAGSLNNTLNLLGFPGIVESHYAIGGTYNFSEQTSMDIAYVYSPEVDEKFTVANPQGSPAPTRDIETKHSQSALSLAVNFMF